ncbi:MAG TPA: DUF418 domain-containing protein [Candidatus Corynebacterium avicola]|uniref:DUF418 domain-containing protein n=1 Tax=Candidatus Corynebacterium avicola TaxID=2838527 RepID=A0A9D1RMC0_9CORY|nr:DUF418 domain-containing protein [Candidatus Corynebacterium avicola]
MTGPTLPQRRITALDALRGFALCGIIYVNIPQTLGMMDVPADAPEWMHYAVIGRFYPIFSFLFGLGFGLFLASASRRTERPRVPLVRRMIVLVVLGALHHLLQPGEVLLWYGLVGLIVLLPFSYLKGRTNLLVGAVLLAAAVSTGLGILMIPGLFLVGFALAQLGQVGRLAEDARLLGITLTVGVVLAVVAFIVVASEMLVGVAGGFPERAAGLVFQLSTSCVYACVFLLVLKLPELGQVLETLFAPMGRMALTNYITGTLLFVLLGYAVGLDDSAQWGRMALLATGILLVQVVWSHLWLRFFRYGPLEWVWRCITYWNRVSLR